MRNFLKATFERFNNLASNSKSYFKYVLFKSIAAFFNFIYYSYIITVFLIKFVLCMIYLYFVFSIFSVDEDEFVWLMSCSFLKRHCSLELQEFLVCVAYMHLFIFSYKLIKRDLSLLIFNYEEAQRISFLEAYLRLQRYTVFKNTIKQAYNYHPYYRIFFKNTNFYVFIKILSLPYNLFLLLVWDPISHRLSYFKLFK